MAKDDKGQPPGSNKVEGLGTKPVMPAENLEGSEDMGEKHTEDEDQLADNVRQRGPERDADKGTPTNAGR